MENKVAVIVLVSANVEWKIVRENFPGAHLKSSPYGEWFYAGHLIGAETARKFDLIYFHGGWGKIAAAGSAQYVIDRWSPKLIVNLGTCGGFGGEIERGEIILVERTLVYDIIEQMGDYDEHIAHYSTDIDLSWLGEHYPLVVRKSLLVSGDRDLLVEDIPDLKARFHAVAGDWESGAIAWVASRNQVKCLILRGVTDLVSSQGGEAYGDIEVFAAAARPIMKRLIESLPEWVERANI